LAKYAKLREDLDLALDALKASRDALDQLEDGSKDKMDVDSGNAASKWVTQIHLSCCENLQFRGRRLLNHGYVGPKKKHAQRLLNVY
jgi:hypothetical protein